MSKKILIFTLIFLSVFSFVSILRIRAGQESSARGWGWGGSDDGVGSFTGVGAISLNNINPGAGGPFNYGVNIPFDLNCTGTACKVTGYAYSENIGYLDFSPQDNCVSGVPGPNQYQAASCTAPDNSGNGGVFRVGNELVGWARIVGIAQESVNGNSGGWDGWIKMKGVATSGVPYGVVIDPATRKLSGYAWNSEGTGNEGLGALAFQWTETSAGLMGNVYLPPAPVITLSANPFTINLDGGKTLPQDVTLTWGVTGADSCLKSGGGWNGTIAAPTNAVDAVTQTVPSVTYKLECSGPGGTVSQEVLVTTGCTKKLCGSNLCNGEFLITGGSNDSTCVAQSNCTADYQCKARQDQVWREVAP